jgi:hypothetical protein
VNPSSRTAVDRKAEVTFDMVVAAATAVCLPDANGSVTITPTGPVETMDVTVLNLPPTQTANINDKMVCITAFTYQDMTILTGTYCCLTLKVEHYLFDSN